MIAARTARSGQATDTESTSRPTFRDAIPMRPVAIKITTSTQVDRPPTPVYESPSKPLDLEEGEILELDAK